MDDFQFVVFFKVFNPDVLNNGTLAPKTLNTTEIIKIKKNKKNHPPLKLLLRIDLSKPAADSVPIQHVRNSVNILETV